MRPRKNKWPSASRRRDGARAVGGVISVILLVLWSGGCERQSGASTAESGGRRKVNPEVALQPHAGPAASARPEKKVADAPAAPPRVDEDKTASRASPPASADRRFVAYYFHRTMRCDTCRSIEEQSQAAIEAGFPGELGDGRLAWQAINIEEPGNEHFEQEFGLDRQALVMVEMEGPKATRFLKLERVWELVDNPPAFEDYVRKETRAFLDN